MNWDLDLGLMTWTWARQLLTINCKLILPANDELDAVDASEPKAVRKTATMSRRMMNRSLIMPNTRQARNSERGNTLHMH